MDDVVGRRMQDALRSVVSACSQGEARAQSMCRALAALRRKSGVVGENLDKPLNSCTVCLSNRQLIKLCTFAAQDLFFSTATAAGSLSTSADLGSQIQLLPTSFLQMRENCFAVKFDTQKISCSAFFAWCCSNAATFFSLALGPERENA